MKLFCRHDWIAFQKSTELKHTLKKQLCSFTGESYYVTENFYSKEPTINKDTGKVIGTTYNHSLGFLEKPITNDVCSKCFSLRMTLDKARDKSKKREKKANAAAKKKREKDKAIRKQREDAKAWALKFYKMKNKA